VRWRAIRAEDREGVEARINGRNSYYHSPVIVVVSRTLNSRAQRAKIVDAIVLPEDSMSRLEAGHRIDFTVLRKPRDPPTRIDRISAAEVAARKRTEIGEDTVLPLKSVRDEAVWVARKSSGRWDRV